MYCPLFLIGVALGNIVYGVPLDAHHEFSGNFLTLLHPYPLLLGVSTVALFAMHGNIYLIMKTEGELQAKLRRWIKITIPIFVLCFLAFGILTPFVCPQIKTAFFARPLPLIITFSLAMLLVFNIPREVHKGREFRAFLSSCGAMAFLMMTFGLSVFPNMVFSTPELVNSLTIYNGSSTEKTLGIMLIVAIFGVPIVLTYTACVYYIFRGKVVLTEDSY